MTTTLREIRMENDVRTEQAFQDLIPHNFCFGCGPANAGGLQIKSFWTEDPATAVCTWTPEPHHAAGPSHVLNGGIIATLIDCHCVCTAMAQAYREEGRAVGSDPHLWFATGSLQVKYLKPTRLDEPVRLVASIEKSKWNKVTLSCDLFSGNDRCAIAKVVAVRVPASWLIDETKETHGAAGTK